VLYSGTVIRQRIANLTEESVNGRREERRKERKKNKETVVWKLEKK
jgi:hypothetical protein